MQRDIQIVVKDRVARAVGQPVIVCGNGDYTITFSFDEEWGGTGTKTARFKYLTAEGMKHIDKELKGNVAQVPVLSNIREVEVGVYAGGLATSTGAPIRCEPSVRCGSGEEEEDILQPIIEATQEACRAELETSIETATGENHDNKTWEELNETVSTLPIISEEQTQALGDWDLVKFYYANFASDYVRMFRTAPKDETGADMDYRLPYIYTPKINWASGVISQNLLEFGVDVSRSGSVGSLYGGLFSGLPKLQRLIVTGNEKSQSLQCFMHQNTSLQYVKMETPSEEVLRLESSYYRQAFHYCSNLVTIDCELDFTGQTGTMSTFAGCSKLKNLRIKPFTLSTSLNLGECRSLHINDKGDYDSLISILNAITLDRETAKNITITFSSEITDFTTDGGFWSCSVWWQEDGTYTLEEGNSVFVEPVSLYDAFITKGVTIAWT